MGMEVCIGIAGLGAFVLIAFFVLPKFLKFIVVKEGEAVITIGWDGKLCRALGPGQYRLSYGEKNYATIPTRELVYESSEETVRTKVLFPVTVNMVVHYQVVDPLKMARTIPVQITHTAPEWPDWKEAIEREAVETLFTIIREKGPIEVGKNPEHFEGEIQSALSTKMLEYGVQIRQVHLKHIDMAKSVVNYAWGEQIERTKVKLQRIAAEGEREEKIKDIIAEHGALTEAFNKLKERGYDDNQAMQYIDNILRYWALREIVKGGLLFGMETREISPPREEKEPEGKES